MYVCNLCYFWAGWERQWDKGSSRGAEHFLHWEQLEEPQGSEGRDWETVPGDQLRVRPWVPARQRWSEPLNSSSFCLLFVNKIIDLPGRLLNDPSLVLILFSSVPLSILTPLSLTRAPDGIFELAKCFSRAFYWGIYFVLGTSEIQGHSQVCRIRWVFCQEQGLDFMFENSPLLYWSFTVKSKVIKYLGGQIHRHYT